MQAQSKTVRLTRLALLTAVVLVLAYTPLGYIRFFALEITPIMIPVTVGSILLGPTEGAILGGVFGLTSFGACFGSSLFGSALLSIDPVSTFLTCVLARILAGWIPGLAFRFLHQKKGAKNLSFGVASLLGPVLNTVFFMSALVLFFYQTDYIQSFAATLGATNPFAFVLAFVGVQGLIEAVVGFVVSGLLSRALYRVLSNPA